MSHSTWILAATVACACSACSQAPSGAAGTAGPAAGAATSVEAPRGGSVVPGIDLAWIDHAVAPGDDFYQYANGAWLRDAKIPSDRASIGAFYDVFQVTERHTAELIQGAGKGHPAAGSAERRIADYYAAWMDEDAIERRGLATIQPELDAVSAIASRADLARVLGSRLRADVDPINNTNYHTQNLFGLFVTKGLREEKTQIPYLLQGGLGMPGRDYYLSADPQLAATRAKYGSYIAALLAQAGLADAPHRAAQVLALETRIAQAQESLVESQDIHKADNVWAPGDFPRRAPGLDWTAYFQAAGLDGAPEIDVWQPAAIQGLSRLVASEPIAAWRALLTFHALNAAAPLLPRAYADLHFGFYGKVLAGTPEQLPRWKRAVAATNDDLGDAVGRLYVARYFPPEAKAAAEAMVKNLIAAFRDGIKDLAWMSPETRAKAEAKLDTLRVGVGYPERWRDDDGLVIRADDALGNHRRVLALRFAQAKAKISTPIDDGEWWMTPQTVNAVNLPIQNALNFPAAILQPPFFDPAADAAANYGAIGAIIGHEISHGFDTMGADFDAQGRLENWWTAADLEHFHAATDALARQYDRYEALPGLHVNGRQTLGENIADVSGLTAAYRAYHLSLGGKPAPAIDGVSGDQRLFLAYAQSWRTAMREAALRKQVVTNEHAPGRFRAETVRNLDSWYAAFGVPPSAKLYLAPDERVKIW